MNYEEFLESKRIRLKESGFEVKELHPALFDFQEYIVRKALKAGRYAVFADCGLGKTIIQLVWADEVVKHTGRPVLILAPLAVSGQTIHEGQKFGIEVTKWLPEFLRLEAVSAGIYITNYEQLEHVNAANFTGIVLDESSILKNFNGATYKKLCDSFSKTQYRLCCTATPSPNDTIELTNHSEFLGIMPSSEVLAMYFTHDGGTDMVKWKLKGHSEHIFWEWVSLWAVMLSKPSDIGFTAKGFDLPDLNFIEKKVITDKRNNGQLFNDVSISATNFNQELRLTKVARMRHVIELVNNSEENFIIWIKQNEEGEYLRKLIPDAVEVKGSDSPEYKEEMLLGFAQNKFRILLTKSRIASFGLNYQNCHNQVFASLDFSFESLYQSIRRSYRFGQTHPVNIYLVTTDTMTNVIQAIEKKQRQFEKMQHQMTRAINSNYVKTEKRTTEIDIQLPNFLYAG